MEKVRLVARNGTCVDVYREWWDTLSTQEQSIFLDWEHPDHRKVYLMWVVFMSAYLKSQIALRRRVDASGDREVTNAS